MLAIVASVGLAAALLTTATAAAQDRPENVVEALGLVVLPLEDPLSETYGAHAGIAGRYSYQPGRWSIAGEIGWRSAGGETASFGFAAEIRIVQVAVLGRLHGLLGGGARPWDLWAGAGLVHQRVREEVAFPGEAAESSEGATGLMLAAGVRRRLGDGWGWLGELRFSRLSAPEPAPAIDGAQLGGLEAGVGLWVSF